MRSVYSSSIEGLGIRLGILYLGTKCSLHQTSAKKKRGRSGDENSLQLILKVSRKGVCIKCKWKSIAYTLIKG